MKQGKPVSLDWVWTLWKNSENWLWFIRTSHKNKAVFLCKLMLHTIKHILFEKSNPSTYVHIVIRYNTGRQTQMATSPSSEGSVLPLISSGMVLSHEKWKLECMLVFIYFYLHSPCNNLKCFTWIVRSQSTQYLVF